MSARRSGAKIAPLVGWLLLALGIAVFVIRLQHAGPYDAPKGGNLAAALAALALGACLTRDWLGDGAAARALRLGALAGSVPVLCPPDASP